MENVLIYGDSYSTFKGYIAEGNIHYYPRLDLTRVEETWWHRLITEKGYNLIENNSWSGSTVGYTGFSTRDKEDRLLPGSCPQHCGDGA